MIKGMDGSINSILNAVGKHKAIILSKLEAGWISKLNRFLELNLRAL